MAGLWDIQSGTVSRPDHIGRDGLFFVPQRPFTTKGSLRAQILYPLSAETTTVSEGELIDILKVVDLEEVLRKYGLDKAQEWSEVLSVGEMQRLGFARLYFHRPRFAIMDEATSALDMLLEERCLVHCGSLNITMVSVAHRPSVVRFHKRVMVLDGKGSFSMHPVGVDGHPNFNMTLDPNLGPSSLALEN
jgi:ABC-type uncharacterized transport system fused permease/ATPase subunit